VLRGNLESHDKDVEELKVEISRQSDHDNNLWLVHETSLEEVQKIRPEVIALRSDVQVKSTREWLGARTGAPRVLAPGSRGRVIGPGERSIVLRAVEAGIRDPGDGQRIGAVAVGGIMGLTHFFYG